MSAGLINCVAFNPSHFTSLFHLFIHPVVMNHARAVCHSPPHCLAPTLSRSTRSHTVSLYLVLTLSHVRFHTSFHMVSSSVNVSHLFALFRMHLTVCRATGQPSVQRTDIVATLSHARFDAQVTPIVAATTVAAHTLLRQPLLHYCCTIQHTTRHTNRCCTDHCCTNHCCTSHAAPYIERFTK